MEEEKRTIKVKKGEHERRRRIERKEENNS